MRELFLLMGRTEDSIWPVALYTTQADAKDAAVRCEAYAKGRQAAFDAWHRSTYLPWYDRVNPIFGPDAPDYPDRPLPPPYPDNPDDPKHCYGDDYWVEPIDDVHR